jgi:hypothetical protein
MKRTILLTGIAISGLLTPLSVLPALFVVNSINPMQLVFVTSFTVTNNSGRTLDVVPVGTFNDGRKGLLPTFASRVPAFPHFKRVPYRIGHGETQTVLYDCDDINFSELAVQDEAGTYRQLVTDANPPTDDYRAPGQKGFTIPDFSQLDAVDPLVLAAANRQGGLIPSWWALASLALPPFALACFVLALRKKGKRRNHAGGGQPPVPPALARR